MVVEVVEVVVLWCCGTVLIRCFYFSLFFGWNFLLFYPFVVLLFWFFLPLFLLFYSLVDLLFWFFLPLFLLFYSFGCFLPSCWFNFFAPLSTLQVNDRRTIHEAEMKELRKKNAKEDELAALREKQEMELAAMKLQAIYRGRKLRIGFDDVRAERLGSINKRKRKLEGEMSAIKIQGMYRSWKARKILHGKMEAVKRRRQVGKECGWLLCVCCVLTHPVFFLSCVWCCVRCVCCVCVVCVVSVCVVSVCVFVCNITGSERWQKTRRRV